MQRGSATSGDAWEVTPARPVLVADGGGWWSGQLRGWEQIGGTWHGNVVWDHDGTPKDGTVPADRLRPFVVRTVEVWVAARNGWYPGRLIGAQRRPRYDWEALVEPWDRGEPGEAAWYPFAEVRFTDPPLPSS